MFRYTRREKICSINIHTPKFPHSINGIGNRVKVLGKASRRYQIINSSMLLNNLRQNTSDRIRIGNIAIVSGDLGKAEKK